MNLMQAYLSDSSMNRRFHQVLFHIDRLRKIVSKMSDSNEYGVQASVPIMNELIQMLENQRRLSLVFMRDAFELNSEASTINNLLGIKL